MNRPASRFTRAFKDTCAWIGARCSGAAIAEFLRAAWRSVTAVIERVVADARGGLTVTNVHALTWDQGTEMSGHLELTASTGLPVYFCEPRSP